MGNEMTEVLTSAQMRGIEARAIAGGLVTGLALMERAGRAVVEAVIAQWPAFQTTAGHAVVLCGPGNNGGDGHVIARLLKARGWQVTVFFLGRADRLPPDAAVQLRLWQEAGGAVLPLDDSACAAVAAGSEVSLCIDALFGTGLTRPLEPALCATLAALGACPVLAGARRVAVDLASGLCADSGRVLGGAGACLPPLLSADLTVTFHRAKPGHLLADGPAHGGRLVVADIGLAPDPAPPVEVARRIGPPAPQALAKQTGHKFDHGHALVLAGGPGQGGAARLAARAALRIGAGLVTLACPPPALPENAARLDAVMLRPLTNAAGLTALLEDRRIRALCLGPALGATPREAALLEAALADRRPAVLDADALTLLAQAPRLRAALHGGCVLTPHDGEAARLFPDLAARRRQAAPHGPAFSKLDAARAAARQAGCVVLLKGADTVIADPSGRAAIHAAIDDQAAPWLATAGAGDVLAGLIAGLLARGMAPFEAACAGAWLHAAAARDFGPGLIAEDLPEALPRVLRGLGV